MRSGRDGLAQADLGDVVDDVVDAAEEERRTDDQHGGSSGDARAARAARRVRSRPRQDDRPADADAGPGRGSRQGTEQHAGPAEAADQARRPAASARAFDRRRPGRSRRRCCRTGWRSPVVAAMLPRYSWPRMKRRPSKICARMPAPAGAVARGVGLRDRRGRLARSDRRRRAAVRSPASDASAIGVTPASAATAAMRFGGHRAGPRPRPARGSRGSGPPTRDSSPRR